MDNPFVLTDVDDIIRGKPPLHTDCQALAGELVQHIERKHSEAGAQEAG